MFSSAGSMFQVNGALFVCCFGEVFFPKFWTCISFFNPTGKIQPFISVGMQLANLPYPLSHLTRVKGLWTLQRFTSGTWHPISLLQGRVQLGWTGLEAESLNSPEMLESGIHCPTPCLPFFGVQINQYLCRRTAIPWLCSRTLIWKQLPGQERQTLGDSGPIYGSDVFLKAFTFISKPVQILNCLSH